MFFGPLLLFTLIPALEIYLLFTVGSQIGALNTIFIVIITGIIGAALAKSQGVAVFNRIKGDLAKGHIPANEFIGCLLIFGGGLLLLTPGFLTDILGILMVLPGSRNILSLLLKEFFGKIVKNGAVHYYHANNMSTDEDIFSQVNSCNQDDRNTFEAEYRKKN